jgi:hypothetical protein
VALSLVGVGYRSRQRREPCQHRFLALLAEILLPDSVELGLTEVMIEENMIVLAMEALYPTAVCTDCHIVSQRVYNHYQRAIFDLPYVGRNALPHLTVRCSFCDNAR